MARQNPLRSGHVVARRRWKMLRIIKKVSLVSVLLLAGAIGLADDIGDLEKAIRKEFGRSLVQLEVKESIYNSAGEVATERERRALLVDVKYKANLPKGYIELVMKQGFEVIFGAGIPIRKATIEAQLRLIDNLGNESWGPVYRTGMWDQIGNRINWENMLALDFSRLVGGLLPAPGVQITLSRLNAGLQSGVQVTLLWGFPLDLLLV